MATRLRPLHDRILVQRIEETAKTRGGLHIPDSAREKPIQGTVIAVGRGTVDDAGKVRPLEVKKGDRVLFGKYSGTEINLHDEKYLVLREDEVFGVVGK